jgi:transposase
MAERRADDSWRIPDTLWADMELFLPPRENTHRFGGGRPRVPDRACMDAIFFVLRAGCQWTALDATGICKGSTAHNRFQEWVQAGVFRELWKAGLLEYDARVGIDWEWLRIDGAMTKAPLGGEKDRPESYGSRQRRRQAQRPGRGRRGAGRAGGGRGQPQRPPARAGDVRLDPGRAAGAHRGGPAKPVRGQRV